jgi:hypothetical protein
MDKVPELAFKEVEFRINIKLEKEAIIEFYIRIT